MNGLLIPIGIERPPVIQFGPGLAQNVGAFAFATVELDFSAAVGSGVQAYICAARQAPVSAVFTALLCGPIMQPVSVAAKQIPSISGLSM